VCQLREALLLGQDPSEIVEEARAGNLTVAGSAATGEGLGDLIQAMNQALRLIMVRIEAVIPYSAGDVLNQVRRVHRRSPRRDCGCVG
jgi:50S ribosomal subunit-associated GTPase HflX